MNNVFRLSLVSLFAVLVLAVAGCGSKSTGDVADDVKDVADSVMNMHTVDAKHYTIAIYEGWKHNANAAGSHADVLDENDQPRLAINYGRLSGKQTGMSVAAAQAKKHGSTVSEVSKGIYTYTVENRASEQVPVTLKVRGKNYVTIQQSRGEDSNAAKVADSLYLK